MTDSDSDNEVVRCRREERLAPESDGEVNSEGEEEDIDPVAADGGLEDVNAEQEDDGGHNVDMENDFIRDEPRTNVGGKKERYVSHLQYIRYKMRRMFGALVSSEFTAGVSNLCYSVRSSFSLERYPSIPTLGYRQCSSSHQSEDVPCTAKFHPDSEEQEVSFLSDNDRSSYVIRNAFFKMMAVHAEKADRRLGMTITMSRKQVGSPAYMKKVYEDTIVMVAAFGPPDLFITFTANKKWKEIEVCLT